MDRLEIVLTIISVVSSFSSILFAFLAFKRNSNGDNKREGKNEGAFLADISYIKKSMEQFVKSHDAHLTTMIEGEHWFHKEEQLAFLKNWLLQYIKKKGSSDK